MKVLVTSKSFGRAAPDAIEMLQAAGFELVWASKPSLNAEEIAKEVVGCDALIVGNDPVPAQVIDASSRLKVVHMHGTGLDAIDVVHASEKGVYVANAPGANCNAVAELTVGLLLIAARSIDKHIEIVRSGEWRRFPGVEVAKKTLGVVGLGAIGKRFIHLMSGFDVSVNGFDVAPDRAWAAENSVTLVDNPEAIFANSDFVVLALSLNEHTRNFVNAERLRLMKPSAYLINTARGGLVDVGALCTALRNKQIAGAAIDVFDPEPLAVDSELRNVGATLTPHLAATSVESAGNVSRIVAKNLIDILVNKKLGAAVNLNSIRSS